MNFDKELERQRIAADLQERKYFKCNRCNSEIYDGEEYYFYERDNLCEECFDEIQENEKIDCRRIAGDDDE